PGPARAGEQRAHPTSERDEPTEAPVFVDLPPPAALLLELAQVLLERRGQDDVVPRVGTGQRGKQLARLEREPPSLWSLSRCNGGECRRGRDLRRGREQLLDCSGCAGVAERGP